MPSLWLIARHEYRQTVVRRGFLVGILAIPLLIALSVGIAIAVEVMAESPLPMGYVDQAGFLDVTRQTQLPEGRDRLEMRAYPDLPAAQAALERQEIQAFFVFPADYRQSLRTELYYLEQPPSSAVWRQFDDFVRLNWLAALPDETRQRVFAGPSVTVHDTASGREFGANTIINIILPIAASFFFFVTTMSATGYMLQVVAGEKENRTLEIMVTTVTPGQLIGGKALGLLAATLTQLLVYVIAVVVGLIVAAPYVPLLRNVTVPWSYLGLMALFFIPAYALIAALMIAIGSAVSDLQQGQQIAGLLNLLFILPVFLLVLLLENPSHPAVLLMTFFPTTSFLTISLRWGLSTIPAWQLGLSWLILVGTTLVMIWAAARVFRAGMLRYGQPLSLKTALAAIRGR